MQTDDREFLSGSAAEDGFSGLQEDPSTEYNESDTKEFVPGDDHEVPDNEFKAVIPEDRDDSFTKARKERKKVREKKNFLLQAAAIVTAIVVITSSVGADVLGDELSGGELTEALRRAGARTGLITVSMLWENSDDIDLHVVTPSGEEIFFGNPVGAGGELDVDMQVSEIVRNPVENIYFTEPAHGEYTVYINNFTDRNEGDAKVLVRVTVRGRTSTYNVTLDEWYKKVCSFTY